MKRYFVVCASLLIVFFFVQVSPLRAEPLSGGEPSFSVNVPYTGVVIGEKGKAEVEITLRNATEGENVVALSIEGFSETNGVRARLVSDKWSGYGVTRVRLGRGESFNEAKAVIVLTPAKDAKPGMYEGALVVTPEAGGEAVRVPLVVKYEAEEVLPVEKLLETSCTYPVVENAAGSSFTYEIKIENKGKESLVTDFSLSVPAGWSGSISPRWESGRKIQSFRMEGNKTETLMVTVTPPSSVKKGEYPVTFTAGTGEEESVVELKAVVTGTYDLSILPDNQRLNFDTQAGSEKTVTLFVWNDGSAPINNVKFFANKPDDWDVSFEPESLSSVAPLASTGKPEQVKMKVKAPERTIPGDYLVALTASGDESDEKITLRATVKVSTVWGWSGILVIAVVLVLLFGTFWKLKRR